MPNGNEISADSGYPGQARQKQLARYRVRGKVRSSKAQNYQFVSVVPFGSDNALGRAQGAHPKNRLRADKIPALRHIVRSTGSSIPHKAEELSNARMTVVGARDQTPADAENLGSQCECQCQQLAVQRQIDTFSHIRGNFSFRRQRSAELFVRQTDACLFQRCVFSKRPAAGCPSGQILRLVRGCSLQRRNEVKQTLIKLFQGKPSTCRNDVR